MSDWLDEKLAAQALRDEQQQKETESRRRQAEAVRNELPRYFADLGKHIESLVDRYNDANVGRPEREIMYTVDADGCLAVGITGSLSSSPLRAVYCKADLHRSTIGVEWRLPGGQDASNQKVELSVWIVRNGDVVVSDGRSKFRGPEAFARYLLVPVLFPEIPDRKATRAIAVDDGDELF